jgi:hypothetical protein
MQGRRNKVRCGPGAPGNLQEDYRVGLASPLMLAFHDCVCILILAKMDTKW